MPFHGALKVLNSGYLGYIRGKLGGLGTQSFQSPLIKEDTLNQMMDPTVLLYFKVYSSTGVLEALGTLEP